MSKPPSNTGRLLDDDMPPAFGTAGASRPRPTVVPPTLPPQPEPQRLAAPVAPTPPPLQPAQRVCYEALGLALQEGHVFAAVTGPDGSGKSTVLEAVLADRHDRALRCIRISDPDKVPARLAAQIEQVAYTEAGKPENLERHVVLAIDDAHTASNELLRCLARLAAMREPGRRVPQVLLVGRPELWSRLATEEYAPLARRLAIRAVLPKLQDEQDPWASLEQEVSQTMSQLRAEREQLPTATAGLNVAPVFDRTLTETHSSLLGEFGAPFDEAEVPPLTDFALFPDPPARLEKQHRSSSSNRRLLLPLGCLMAAVAAFTFVLSFFDWPGLLDGMPWADSKPSAAFAFNDQPNPPGLPQTPAWAQPTQRAATPPRGAPPAPSPATLSSPRPTVAPAPAEPAASAPKPPDATVAEAAPPPAEPVRPVEPPKPVAASVPEPSRAVPPPASPAVAQASAPVPEPVTSPTPAAEPPVTVAALTASPLAATAPRSIRGPLAVVKPAPLPPAIVGLLLRRGDEQLAIGDVFAARLLFERAAESGNAQGAFRLARTYDPSYLPATDASTLANRNEARVWYGRAASLGDREAASRLKELNEGH